MYSPTSTSRERTVFPRLSPNDIPPLPESVVELLDIANDPAVSFATLSTVISRDQALTVRILAVANSPFYGCSRRIDSVRSAIAVLGTRQVQNIASAMALAPAFESHHGPRLWQHGLTTAVWTKHVVRALGIPPLDYVFTAGLLHDIGVVLLLGYAPEIERACLDQAENENRHLEEVESEHLGTDHAHVGARACASWRLPDRLTELVAQHHEHRESDRLDLEVLHAANALARICESTRPGPTSAGWDATLQALTRLGFTEEEILRLLEHRSDVLAEADAFA